MRVSEKSCAEKSESSFRGAVMLSLMKRLKQLPNFENAHHLSSRGTPRDLGVDRRPRSLGVPRDDNARAVQLEGETRVADKLIRALVVVATLFHASALLAATKPTTRQWTIDGVKREALIFAPA